MHPATRILCRVVVYAVFSAAGACFLLAVLCVLGGAGLWLGLGETGGFRLAALFVAGWLVAIGLGFLAHALELRRSPTPAKVAPRAEAPQAEGGEAVPDAGGDADDAPLDAPP